MRLRACLIQELRNWLIEHGYLEVHVPILVNAAVEGGSTLFEVKYFGEKAYLTQSWQLYAEAMISSVGKIFTLAPSFRAEKSRTIRHLTEYWHLEVEEPWLDLDGLMRMEEQLVSSACQKVRKKMPEELKLIGRETKELETVEPPFPRLRYDEAVRLVQKAKPNFQWVRIWHGRKRRFSQRDSTNRSLSVTFPRRSRHFITCLIRRTTK